MSKFNVGDVVACKDRGPNNYIAVGDRYTVLRADGNAIRIVNNDGDECWYANEHFELAKTKEDLHTLIDLAQSMIGKTGVVKGGAQKIKINRVKVYLHEKDVTGDSSFHAEEMFKELGFAVTVHSDYSQEADVRKVEFPPESYALKLTDDYSAKIYADKVVVGCQTIPKDVVVALYENLMKLQ